MDRAGAVVTVRTVLGRCVTLTVVVRTVKVMLVIVGVGLVIVFGLRVVVPLSRVLTDVVVVELVCTLVRVRVVVGAVLVEVTVIQSDVSASVIVVTGTSMPRLFTLASARRSLRAATRSARSAGTRRQCQLGGWGFGFGASFCDAGAEEAGAAELDGEAAVVGPAVVNGAA